MKMLASYCFLPVLVLAAAPATSQDQGRNQANAQAKTSVADSLPISSEPGQAVNAPLPSIGEISTDLFMAGSADRGGDAIYSLDQYQRILDAASRGIAGSPAGSAERMEWIRKATEAGYYLAWARLDQKDEAAAALILQRLSEWLTPFDRPGIVPKMRLPVARWLWLQARRASEKGAKDEDARLRTRVLMLTANRMAFPDDYGPLSRLHITALWSLGQDKQRSANRAKACQIAAELEKVVANSMTIRLVECDIEAAQDQLSAKRFDAALATLDRARRRSSVALRAGNNLDLKIQMIEVENNAASVERERGDLAAEARIQVAAARMLAEALSGTTFFQNSTDQIATLYNGFKNLDVKLVPGYDTKEKQARLQTELFGRLAESIEPSRRAFPRSPYFASVVADASGRAADAHARLASFDQALAFAERAVAAVEESGLLSQLSEFSEDAASVCLAHARKVEALVGLRRADAALSAHSRLREQCGSWLTRYPWDFYARQYMTSAVNKLGQLLADERRYAEAVPLLRYSSNWSLEEASTRLATLYRDGLGVGADLPRAAQLDKLAARQSMKRFTVPTDFNGVKYPFNVYVMQYGDAKRCPADRSLTPEEADCAGFVGIDDQAQWVKVARGGTVPADVITSFQKLDKIARENDVSFPDLTVYALGAAQREGQGTQGSHARAETSQPSGAGTTSAGTAAPLARPDSVFFSIQYGPDKPIVTPATRISRSGPAKCFGWAIQVPPEDRMVALREDYFLPGPPGTPHEVSENSTISDGGRKISTRLSLPAKEGMLTHGWCASQDDPLGAYRLEVYRDNILFRSFEFEMVN